MKAGWTVGAVVAVVAIVITLLNAADNQVADHASKRLEAEVDRRVQSDIKINARMVDLEARMTTAGKAIVELSTRQNEHGKKLDELTDIMKKQWIMPSPAKLWMGDPHREKPPR